ncbi:iron-sulfur cluster-binding protein [Betaproteobacteria bacterium]|nr:iron-sulfur cluster-binding protein [Betaproteobacteria bacterium]
MPPFSAPSLPDLKTRLKDLGACLVGFADLSRLPDEAVLHVFRRRLHGASEKPAAALRGVSIAVAFAPEIVAGLGKGPTRAYYDAYHATNDRLDTLASHGARLLEEAGFSAWALTRENVQARDTLNDYATRLPHKTVATLAGLGWVGKNALLVTRQFGAAIRLTSVVTDAPLPCDAPVSVSHCGRCAKCVDICPADALTNAHWQPGVTTTDDLVDTARCSIVAAALSKHNYGISFDICGKCFYVCPFTQKWLRRSAPGQSHECQRYAFVAAKPL